MRPFSTRGRSTLYAPPTQVAASQILDDGTLYLFDGAPENQRPALLLDHGAIYAAFGNACAYPRESGRGWVLAWSASTLLPLRTPNGTTYDGVNNLPETAIKMSGRTGSIESLFTPSVVAQLDQHDMDFGNSTPRGRRSRRRPAFGDCRRRLHVIDVVYIDARHTFEAVTKDLAQAIRVVKPGGLAILNDYTLFDPWLLKPLGVVQAANAAVIEFGLKFVYFSLQLSGFYDVASRIPHESP